MIVRPKWILGSGALACALLCGSCFRSAGAQREPIGSDSGTDGDADDFVPDAPPSVERCNGEDDDGDGEIDDGFECAAGEVEPCPFCDEVEGERECAADCTWGECEGACPSATTCCDDACTDLATDPENCSECGVACGEELPSCCAGTCVSTQTDPANCGVCGTVCSVDWVCEQGICVDAS